MAIKWINKFSGEQGYVKSINTKEKHFINTWEQSEAKVYKTEASAQKAISRLIEFGEGDNNTFELVSA
jgi:hypothetical protein